MTMPDDPACAAPAEPFPSLAARLGWVSFFNDASSEVIARAMPLFLMGALGASPVFVGAVEGAAEALSIFLKGFSGWLSDRMRVRKPLVVGGYALSVASRVMLLAAHVPVVAGGARLLDRSGKGLRVAPRDALVADAAAEGRAGSSFGITRFLDTLGAITGIAFVMALGLGDGPLDAAAFRRIVLWALPFGAASLAVLIFAVPNPARHAHAKTYLSWRVPKPIRGYLAIVFVFALGNSSDAFLVIKAKELGLSFRETLGVLLVFNGLAAALAWPVGRLSDRWGRVPFLALGWVIYAVAYAGMGMATDASAFTASCWLYGAFYGCTEGVEKALLADLLPAADRGTGFGALQLVTGLAALPASLLTGWLMARYGTPLAFQAAGALAGVAAVALIAWRWRVPGLR